MISTTTTAPTPTEHIQIFLELQILEFLAENDDPGRLLVEALMDERNWTVPREVAANLINRYGKTLTVGQALVKARI